MLSIECLVNTVNIPNECKHDLFDEAQSYVGELWDETDNVTDKIGRLYFNPDHMEDMDYLASYLASSEQVINILKRYEVEGDICFGSLGGDNTGSFWGYRFDGKGGMKSLQGKLVWNEKVEVLKGKTVVITGSFPYTTRQEAEEKVREAGGKISKTVSGNTNLLVVGSDPGSKLQKAKKLGVEIISGKDFLAMLE